MSESLPRVLNVSVKAQNCLKCRTEDFTVKNSVLRKTDAFHVEPLLVKYLKVKNVNFCVMFAWDVEQ